MMKATKQIQTKYSSFTLQLKIISGYVLLLALLSIIVSLVWQEHRKMETLNSGEQLISQKREAVNRTFEKLLDFSFSDDFLLLRDSNKFEEYRMKREVATGALNNLKLSVRYSTFTNRQSLFAVAGKGNTAAWSDERHFRFLTHG